MKILVDYADGHYFYREAKADDPENMVVEITRYEACILEEATYWERKAQLMLRKYDDTLTSPDFSY